jgi:2-desacetyl-2-hydroxyethyl bacteriochlorophyllide A dehydrogenase
VGGGVAVRAVTFQAPGEVRVEQRPEPVLESPRDAIVAVEASGICGSDLHIYHGRVKIEPGFTIGHEFVGRVVEAGEQVSRVAPGDRVLGCFHTACGTCFFCLNGAYHVCDHKRTFGHGAAMGSLPGTQAELALVPSADLTLRKVPDGLPDEVALFAGDVMGTGFHAIADGQVRPGDSVAVLGLGPVGLCAVQVAVAAGAGPVLAVDTVADRLRAAADFGATPVHLAQESPRDLARELTGGRGVDVAVDAVGHPDALDLAVRLARKAGTVVAVGVYAERAQVHMGLVWIKGLTVRAGPANVIRHVDRVLGMLASHALDPTPLVTHHMKLEEAAEAYALYDRRQALKIVLTP